MSEARGQRLGDRARRCGRADRPDRAVGRPVRQHATHRQRMIEIAEVLAGVVHFRGTEYVVCCPSCAQLFNRSPREFVEQP